MRNSLTILLSTLTFLFSSIKSNSQVQELKFVVADPNIEWQSIYGFSVRAWYYPPFYNIQGYWIGDFYVYPASAHSSKEDEEMKKWFKYIEYQELLQINEIQNWDEL